MYDIAGFLAEHRALTRRYFLKAGGASLAAAAMMRTSQTSRADEGARSSDEAPDAPAPADLGDAVKSDQPLLTSQEKFYDVSRGDPLPHSLPDDQKQQVGLTRETWKLDVIADPEHPVRVRKPFAREKGTALDFAGLMQLAETHSVRFAKVMTCLNLGCPLGFGLWEGVPLRDVIWPTEPDDKLRRVFYYGYHNEKPEQVFRSSLPIGRVFEDPFDLPPVILCYRLNGQWLTPERGGPVRVVVPEAYGFKSIKWLTHVVLTNLPGANDTYADQGNDVDSPMKSFAATVDSPGSVTAGQKIPVSGYAQAGIGGLSKVQVWAHRDEDPLPQGDPYFLTAPWQDAEILPPPTNWTADLPEGQIPLPALGFDDAGRPKAWPLRLGMVHWAAVLPGLPPGLYTLRCRAVDEKGIPQPLPRPLRKSGHAAIHQASIKVT